MFQQLYFIGYFPLIGRSTCHVLSMEAFSIIRSINVHV